MNLQKIENFIFWVRGEKVMLDSDLAKLYLVPTGRLNEQVKRNRKRFPSDFMFQLTEKEWEVLLSQNAIAKPRRGGRRSPPYVFTEQGVAMLSSVINSDRAIEINIAVMRVFVKMRILLDENKELKAKIETMEEKYDKQFASVFK